MQICKVLTQIPLTLLISAFVIIAHFVGDVSGLMAIDFRSLTLADSHRVFTCHVLHWSWNHLIWDLAMFATLGAIAETNMPRRYRWTLILSALLITAGVMLYHPEMETYRGLSGIDTALFGLIVADLLGRRLHERDWRSVFWFSALLFVMLGKMVMETLAGTNLFVTDTSFMPLPLAHLVGAVTGLLIGSFRHVAAASNWRAHGVSRAGLLRDEQASDEFIGVMGRGGNRTADAVGSPGLIGLNRWMCVDCRTMIDERRPSASNACSALMRSSAGKL
jgi:rhomboid family GlyGly-CTERM serine protease